MSTLQTSPDLSDQTVRVGQVAAVTIVAWIGFALLGDLEATGRHLLVLGALRVVLFATLLAFALRSGAIRSRLGRVALGFTAAMTAVNVFGGVGAVVTDGWSHNPFLGSGEPPWYAYVIGASAMLFAVGTIAVGIAGRAAGWLAVLTVAGGACYFFAFALQAPLGSTTGAAVGHLIWIGPWLALACGLARKGE